MTGYSNLSCPREDFEMEVQQHEVGKQHGQGRPIEQEMTLTIGKSYPPRTKTFENHHSFLQAL
jgi:hypothetical protein